MIHEFEARIVEWAFITPEMRPVLIQFIRWLSAERALSHLTCVNYLSDLKHFFHFLAQHTGGPIALEPFLALSAQDIRSFLAKRMDRGLHRRSNARFLSTLSTLCHFLAEQGLIVRIPLSSIQRPTKLKTLPRPVAPEHALEMLSTKPKDWSDMRNLAALALMYGSGLRISEVLSLNESQWVTPWHQDWLLRIEGKGGKQRYVPVLECVHKLVDLYREFSPYRWNERVPGESGGPLFRGARGGRLNAEVLQAHVRAWRRRLNLPEDTTPHSLRHSCASHLFESGGLLRDIQELLGHASLKTTEIYTEVSQKKILEAYSLAFDTDWSLKEGGFCFVSPVSDLRSSRHDKRTMGVRL